MWNTALMKLSVFPMTADTQMLLSIGAAGFRKMNSLLTLHFLIRNILKFVSIAGVDDTCIINALNSTWPDFEDSVQHEVASQIRADYIVTRNIKDYRNSTIVVVTPTEFMSRV